MIFDFSYDGGLVRLGPFACLWQNQDSVNDYPGFTTLSLGDYSLELGEIDSGNGIFLTKYDGQGDIAYTKSLVQL